MQGAFFYNECRAVTAAFTSFLGVTFTGTAADFMDPVGGYLRLLTICISVDQLRR